MSRVSPDVTVKGIDFSPGFMETPEPDTLPPGATPDARNTLLINIELGEAPRATIRKRTGHRLITPAKLAASSIDGLFEFIRDNAAGELVAICNGIAEKFDNASAFSALTGGTGFTAGQRVHSLQFKNNLLLTDGSQQLRYDGVGCYPIGFDAPTGAPTLTTGAAGAITGTFEGFAVWVDAVTAHLSSPSPTTAQVAFVAQKRAWAKPAGSPPANVTHWRIYSRRVDTNEANFYQTGADQLVATASYTEETADALRRVIGPAPSSNDKPPVFATMGEYKGYRIGAKPNSSDIWISKLNDAESQAPADVFPVGGRGDTKPVVSLRKYSTEFLIQKPTRTYRLSGDTVPFQIDPIDGSFGNVSDTAGVSVSGRWYGWDDRHGPYVTDLNTWTPLANGRILKQLATVNRQYLSSITAVYIEEASLILWFVPTSSSRLRTVLPYHVLLGVWLPPITGLEYSAIARYTTPSGDLDTYVGDVWGRIFTLFDTENDGVPSGTTTATITAATSSSITASAAVFNTTNDGLRGIPAVVISPSGAEQWVRIASNTGTALTLDVVNSQSLNPVPDPTMGTWTVLVGAIDWYFDLPRLTCGDMSRNKTLYYLFLQGAAGGATDVLSVLLRFNRSDATAMALSFLFPPAGMVWGDVWGSYWGGGGERAMRKRRIDRRVEDVQARLKNYYPDQPFEVTYYEFTADFIKKRWVRSA